MLKRDDTIVIRNADKGSCLVVEDRTQYVADGLAHLSDPEVYEEDPSPALAASITGNAAQMEKKGYLSQHMAQFISGNPGRHKCTSSRSSTRAQTWYAPS